MSDLTKCRDRWHKKRVYVKTGIPPRVKTEFANEVNINSIMNKMKKGIIPPAWMTQKIPQYLDMTKTPSTLMEAFDVVQKAQEAFLALPVELRRELDHDPRNLDHAPRSLFEKHGIIKPKAQERTSGRSELAASGEGQGETSLPPKARQGAKNAGHQASTAASSED